MRRKNEKERIERVGEGDARGREEEEEKERERDVEKEKVCIYIYARCFTFHGASLKVAEHVFLNVLPGCREKERNP